MSVQPRYVLATLYAEAFERFGYSCLWSKKPSTNPTAEHARIIAGTLRIEENREAYELARQLEAACDAADAAEA